ncbi:MAG: transposase, partial [Thermodesulfobacteriota bacterium]|nr:transposase [Thermodesulfobacteriota bacterium]
KACKIGHKFNDGHIDRHHAHAFENRLYSAVDTICSRRLKEQKVEAFRKRLLDPKREYGRLFTFLKHPGVQPTNNQAEQSLRDIVIFRKICFGTRSNEGSLSQSVLPSLLLTATRQGQHPLEFFKTLFTSDTPTAQAALYNDSS